MGFKIDALEVRGYPQFNDFPMVRWRFVDKSQKWGMDWESLLNRFDLDGDHAVHEISQDVIDPNPIEW